MTDMYAAAVRRSSLVRSAVPSAAAAPTPAPTLSLYHKWVEAKRALADTSHLRLWVEDLAEVLAMDVDSPDHLELRRRRRNGAHACSIDCLVRPVVAW